MKKCPSCEKTYEDSLRFCQTDGTPLIDDEPAFDPYATIVAPKSVLMPDEPAAVADVVEPEIQAAEESPIAEPDDLLDLPTPDPLKTMFASDSEMKEVLEVSSAGTIASNSPEDNDAEVVTTVLTPQNIDPEPSPSFDPPPSPFAEPQQPTYESAPLPPTYDDEPATVIQSGQSPFDMPAAAPLEMATPPERAVEPAFGGSFSGGASVPTPAAGGQSKTLAIVSLVLGILGFTLCCGSILPSVVAIILGFMARSKASSDPASYGGSGLAMGGIITGVIGLLLSIAYLVFMFALGGLQMVNTGGFS